MICLHYQENTIYAKWWKKKLEKYITDVGDRKIKFICSETNGYLRGQEKVTEFEPIICASTSSVSPFVFEVEKIDIFYYGT